MNKYVKGTMIFVNGLAGGSVIGGIAMLNKFMADDEIRKVIANKIADRITDKMPYPSSRIREYDEVIFATRHDIEESLEVLKDICEKYGHCTIADLYELAGLPIYYTNKALGWHNLDDVTIKRVKDGYVLDLPTPVNIR